MDWIDEAVLENERQGRGRLTYNQLADKLSSEARPVSARTLRRRAARLRVQSTNADLNDSFFKDVPVSAIVQRGKTVRLPDGSYEKVTFKPGAVEMAEARRTSYEDLEKVFAEAPAPVEAPQAKGTFVLCLADFQVGKRGQGGDSADLVRRVRRMFDQVEAALEPCEELILADVGDSTEGFWNVAAQAQTNDLSLTDQIRLVQRLYADALKRFAPKAKKVVYVAVPSNHCAVRVSSGAGNRANAPDDDFGLLVADNLQMVLEGRPGYEHVSFATPEKWEEALTLETVDGTHVAFTHGHLAGKQAKIPQWFADLAFGHRSGLEKADILVHGHFHNFSVGLTGDNRFVIGCPSADNGSDWYTNFSGNRTDPALLSFWASQGKAENWRLYYG